MTFERKRAWIVGLLAAVLLWPALQFVLVRHTQSNPWHLFGMAMYTVPYRVVGIGVARIEDGQPVGLDAARLTPEVQERLDQYANFFDGLGLWAPRDPLYAALHGLVPESDSFLVVLKVQYIDSATGMLEVRRVRVDFDAR